MTLFEIKETLESIDFRGWKFRVQPKGDGFNVSAVFEAPDCNTGRPAEQHTRKWYVSSHAVHSEVVQTAYACVQRAILHEVAEDFYYRGRRIYNPHLSVDELWELAGSGREEIRK